MLSGYMVSLTRFVTTKFGSRPFEDVLSDASVFPARARASHLEASAVAANFPHVVVVVLRLQSVSAFTTYRFQPRRYSASAAVLEEEAAKAAFSSPPHRQNVFT